jgi:hypothetical protein
MMLRPLPKARAKKQGEKGKSRKGTGRGIKWWRRRSPCFRGSQISEIKEMGKRRQGAGNQESTAAQTTTRAQQSWGGGWVPGGVLEDYSQELLHRR